VLLTNLRLFDGTGKSVRQGVQVLIQGKLIAALPSAGEKVEGAQVIDCQGKLVMPGMIDTHWHTMLAAIPQMTAMTADLGYLYISAAQEAQRTLMRGFTSVRDAGGPAFALKRAIDEGMIPGPRIYPSGAMISQTSGHGDFRLRSDIPRAANEPLSMVEQTGVAMIADGETEVLRRVREQLMLGASQIKMLAGGGVASLYDPLDSTQFTEKELRAGVEAAADWNTYVMAHVYTQRHQGGREEHRTRPAGRRGKRAHDARRGRVVEPAAVSAGRGQQCLHRCSAPREPVARGPGHGARL
jgi:imidazolonepropionase-like amidohydrolase